MKRKDDKRWEEDEMKGRRVGKGLKGKGKGWLKTGRQKLEEKSNRKNRKT